MGNLVTVLHYTIERVYMGGWEENLVVDRSAADNSEFSAGSSVVVYVSWLF